MKLEEEVGKWKEERKIETDRFELREISFFTAFNKIKQTEGKRNESHA